MIKEIMNMDNMQNNTVEQNMYGYEQTVNYGYNTNAVQMPNAVTGKIANMVTASAVIWICIAIYQILVGFSNSSLRTAESVTSSSESTIGRMCRSTNFTTCFIFSF